METSLIEAPPLISVIPRSDWCLTEDNRLQDNLLPVNKIVLTITTNFEPCHNVQACLQRIKEIQKHYYNEKGSSEIPFNFLIGNDGLVYEGRGWQMLPLRSQVVPDCSESCIDILVIGCQSGKGFADEVLDMARDFVKTSIERTFIVEDHIVYIYHDDKKLY